MDPEACLIAAETALNERGFDAFRDCLSSYAEWRKRGGFEPTVHSLDIETSGDVFCGLLRTRYGALIGKREPVPDL